MNRIEFSLLLILIVVFAGRVFASGGYAACDWQWINPLPQGDRVSTLVWGDGEYLGIAESGLVQRSIDGKTWQVIAELEEPDKFVGLSWDGSQYLALASGVSGASSRFYVSQDGVNWANELIGTGFLNDFATNGSRVVIVGDSNSIYFSDDLVTFTRNGSFTGNWIAVEWTGTQFVALRDEDQVLTSPDGENWTPHATGVAGKYTSMAQRGTRLAAAGFQGVTMTSTDGVNWEPGASGVLSQSRVYADDAQFILTGPLMPLVSTNGVDWTATTGSLGLTLAFAHSGSDYAAFNTSGLPRYSTDLSSWEDTGIAFTTAILNSIANNETTIVAVGEAGTVAISGDGTSWDVANRLSSLTINDIEWDGSQFVLVGDSGVFATSSDGQDWDSLTTPGSAQLLGIGSDGAGYVAVGNQGSIVSSVDGVTWFQQDSETTQQLNAVASSGSEYIAVGRGGTILRSIDTETWDAMVSGTARELYDVKFGAGQYVAVGQAGTVLTSSNGETWVSQDTPNRRNLLDLQWAFGQFVVTGDATILVSFDGVNWIEDTTFNSLTARASTTLPEAAVVVGLIGAIQYGSCLLFLDGFEK